MAGIMESIHCLSSFGMIPDEEITIICSTAKIYEVKKEIESIIHVNYSLSNFDPNKDFKVLWCGVNYIFKSKK